LESLSSFREAGSNSDGNALRLVLRNMSESGFYPLLWAMTGWIWILRSSGTFPVSRTPRLLGLPDSARRGKQIPQVSFILRWIHGTVHGGNLNRSELV
jgi:hypothetical protein